MPSALKHDYYYYNKPQLILLRDTNIAIKVPWYSMYCIIEVHIVVKNNSAMLILYAHVFSIRSIVVLYIANNVANMISFSTMLYSLIPSLYHGTGTLDL